MKILVTGAKGQLGRELMSVLHFAKTEIGSIPLDFLGTKLVGVDKEEADLTNGETVRVLVETERPDIIFNCAAATNVDGCEQDAKTAYEVNGAAPRNLAVAAQSIGAKLMHISTDYVFPGNGRVPYSEWDAIAPATVYGKSKALGERYVLAQCSRSFVVRTAWLYGRHGNNFVKTMLRLGSEKGHLQVVSDQRGNPTNANDLVHHMLKLAVTEEYGIYHCTGAGECSWYDFATKIMEYAGLPCTVSPCTSEEYPSDTPRPKFSALNHLALDCAVGDEMRLWQEALKSFLAKY